MRTVCIMALSLCIGCQDSKTEAPEESQSNTSLPAAPIASDEERRADFDARQTVDPPSSLPGSWQKLIKACGGKLESVTVRRGSHQTVWRGQTDIKLTFRMFGTDAAVNTVLVDALKHLKLPGFNGKAADQEHRSDTRMWSLELNRLVAPIGAERQTQVVIHWTRYPKAVTERGKCRKPQPVDADEQLPQWLRKHSDKRSTRRRVVSDITRTLEENSGQVVMLYHNGYAHDEGVNHFSSGLKRAGYEHQEGSGPNQQWSHPNGEMVVFNSLNEVHDMGCSIAGPLLSIRWQTPRAKN